MSNKTQVLLFEAVHKYFKDIARFNKYFVLIMFYAHIIIVLFSFKAILHYQTCLTKYGLIYAHSNYLIV